VQVRRGIMKAYDRKINYLNIPYYIPALVDWFIILRCEKNNIEGTLQNNSVTSEEGIPYCASMG